jgi:hypothetical protein
MSRSPRILHPPVHVGDQTGIRTVISISKSARGHTLLTLQCTCGAVAIATVSDFHQNPPVRCQQCQPNRRKHGATGTPEYTCWVRMLIRCYNPTHEHYKYYGGRGITVCPEWRKSFEAFLRDVGLRPSADLSLDRIDVNGNYEPGNVRWATRLVQSQNRRPRQPKVKV